MRVLHLFDFYLPDTLSWVSRLLRHLPDAEVEVAAPWMLDNPFRSSGFRYHRFPLQVSGLLDAETDGQRPCWQRLLTRSQRFLPTYPLWLWQQLRHRPPDVLHAHFGPTGCLYLPLAKKLDRPLVVTFYGFDYQKLLRQRPVFREKYRMLFAGAARVVAASPLWQAELERMGCPPEKIALVRPSLDLAEFPFAERDKPAGRLHLVQAATFTPKKGHLVALEAVRLALADCPNLRLTFAGERYDPVVTRQVGAYIARHGLASRVTWLGPVAHRQMPGFLTAFDACIHPSQYTAEGDHEAVCIALLEAHAVGLPVLATRHGDFPEQVLHGRTGLLVDEGDARALADAIRTMYQMENQAFRQFSQRARRHVEQEFDVRVSAKRLRSVYDGVTRAMT